MRVIVCGLQADVEAIRGRGPTDPMLGALIDAGTYGQVREVASGLQGLQEILGSALDSAAAAAGVALQRRSWPGAAESLAGEGSELEVWEAWPEIPGTAGKDAGETLVAAWHRELAAGAAVAVVVVDRGEEAAPLWALYGHGLPSMGPVATAWREDLWSTWLSLAAPRPNDPHTDGPGRVGVGRNLLEEDPPEVDPRGEAALTERLRQLYGD